MVRLARGRDRLLGKIDEHRDYAERNTSKSHDLSAFVSPGLFMPSTLVSDWIEPMLNAGIFGVRIPRASLKANIFSDVTPL